MGMLFNTAATREMVYKINTEFSSANLSTWRSRLGDFGGGLNLHEIAQKWGVLPTGTGPRARWKHWLVKILHMTACPALMPYPVTGVIQYPAGSGDSNVGRELRRLIVQALLDQNCLEIVMVVQPDYSVRISQAETLPADGMPGKYSLAITLCTIEIPAVIPSASGKTAAKKKAAKKKKA
jgi:hypothetical protein